MPLFPKTVSGLNKSQLLSAAATFDFDATGTTDALRLRLRAYVEANKAAIMANADHCPLFSKKDRDAWATAHRSVTLSDGGTTGTTEAHGHPSLGSPVDTLLPDKTSSPSVQRARLAEIQSEIQRHKLCIEALELEERELDSNLKLIIYPVLTLPSEIVSQIFLQCLPAHNRIRPSPRKAPLVLAQICRYWRQIALSTGRLWRSIDLVFKPAAGPGLLARSTRDDGVLVLLGTWLSRAKGFPVSLTLRSGKVPFVSEIVSVISAFSGQLHRLELALHPDSFRQLRNASPTFPILQVLAIDSHGGSTSETSPASTFGGSRSLREILILTSPHSLVPFGAYPFLTTLELRDATIPALLEALDRCPKLVHLKARLSQRRLPIPPDTTPTTACNLESLTISKEGLMIINPAEPVLTYLILPKLRRLELRHTPQFNVLASFAKRSPCVGLEHLALRIVRQEEARGMIPILCGSSSIVSFDLGVDVHIIHALYTLSTEDNLLPNLMDLTISTCKSDFDYGYLLTFLRQKRDLERRPVQLNSFHLKLYSCEDDRDRRAWLPSPITLLAFEGIMAEGLAVRKFNWKQLGNYFGEYVSGFMGQHKVRSLVTITSPPASRSSPWLRWRSFLMPSLKKYVHSPRCRRQQRLYGFQALQIAPKVAILAAGWL
ncbi:hypothetical protein B0H14DRAFT_3773574 [Mycena olivaceomarginata]|nr:hypothetical protein B0H14DRAFT_3773574 [Mycena olivaceomarginata]